MHTQEHIYYHGEQQLRGFIAYDELNDERRPAVLVVHDWSGRNEFACQKAEMMAKLGYFGFAIDMYGQGRIGETVEEKTALMQPLMNDRQRLRDRLLVALETLKTMKEVDARRIGIIGFCFGGLCALDLARSGADIVGAVSFHGLLHKPAELTPNPIKAKILALHGYEDPMATPQQANLFCQEMTAAGADWQMHVYGHTLHAFTNPNAHDKNAGLIYNAKVARRAMQAMTDFFEEVFA